MQRTCQSPLGETRVTDCRLLLSSSWEKAFRNVTFYPTAFIKQLHLGREKKKQRSHWRSSQLVNRPQTAAAAVAQSWMLLRQRLTLLRRFRACRWEKCWHYSSPHLWNKVARLKLLIPSNTFHSYRISSAGNCTNKFRHAGGVCLKQPLGED